MGHLHATGAELSEDDRSERTIMGGLESISVEAFNEDLAYTASVTSTRRNGRGTASLYAMPAARFRCLSPNSIITIRLLPLPSKTDACRISKQCPSHSEPPCIGFRRNRRRLPKSFCRFPTYRWRKREPIAAYGLSGGAGTADGARSGVSASGGRRHLRIRLYA